MKKKKVLIFDFDGTLYSGKNVFNNIPQYIHSNKRKFLPKISDSEYKKILKNNPNWNNPNLQGSSLVNEIYNLKKKYPHLDISIKDFLHWDNLEPDPIILKNAHLVDYIFMENLCKEYPTYIVSNSSTTHLEYYLKQLNLNKKWFKKVISNQFTIKDRTKKHYYETILTQENCEPKDVFVFGDSVKSDLVPAEKLGMNAIFVDDTDNLPTLIYSALKIIN